MEAEAPWGNVVVGSQRRRLMNQRVRIHGGILLEHAPTSSHLHMPSGHGLGPGSQMGQMTEWLVISAHTSVR